MPLYEYACTQCGQRIEKIQKFSDPPLTQCGKCGGRLKQLLSSPAIQFKGRGWYVTDYARKPSTVSPNGSAGSGNGSKEKGSEGDKSEVPLAKESRKESEVRSQKSE